MLPGIAEILTNSTSSLSDPSYQAGIWFYMLIFLVIFLGAVFVITPLPQNSLLFVSGSMAVTQVVSLEWILVASILGAYIGYDLNYWSGRYFNLTVCRETCPHIFGKKNMDKTEELMKRFGPLSVIISRFIPLVNLPPFYAGLNSMNYYRYMIVNIIGAVMWCTVIVFLGYFAGNLGIVQDNIGILFILVILILIAALLFAGARFIWDWKRRENSQK